MFSEFQIISSKNNLCLDEFGEEYEVKADETLELLVIHCLAKQLKINVPIIGYSIINNEIIILEKIDPHIEYFDDTIRFKLESSQIINPKNGILYQILIDKLRIGFDQSSLGVVWGKKAELIYPLSCLKQLNPVKSPLIFKPINSLDIEKRFDILLNTSFLSKLKTYCSFWQIKHKTNLILRPYINTLLK